MSNNKHSYFSLKGDFFVKEKGTSEAPVYIGNVAEAAFNMSRETITLKSSGNESGDLAVEEVSKSAELSMTLNSMAAKNLAMVLYGTTVAQASVTAAAFTLPALAAGTAYKLAHVNVSNVTITGLTLGVDYKVLSAGGMVVALKDIAATAEGTYDAGTANAVGVFTTSGKEYEVFYTSEASGKSVNILRWQPNPAQALNLISAEFSSFPIAGPCLIDETIAEGPLGRFAVFYDTK